MSTRPDTCIDLTDGRCLHRLLCRWPSSSCVGDKLQVVLHCRENPSTQLTLSLRKKVIPRTINKQTTITGNADRLLTK